MKDPSCAYSVAISSTVVPSVQYCRVLYIYIYIHVLYGL